jgi:hypothetical protein
MVMVWVVKRTVAIIDESAVLIHSTNVNIVESGSVSTPPADLYIDMAGMLARSVSTQASVQPDCFPSPSRA